MSEQETGQLVRELARQLPPVRRIPRLRAVAAGFGGLAVVVALGALWVDGPRENLAALVLGNVGFLAILGGLALAAAGGVLAALGASVPGREGVERAGLALLAAGLVAGLGVGPVALALAAVAAPSPPPARDLDCLLRAVGLAAIPGLALLWFVGRASPRRVALTAGLALAGAVALGALFVHASCPFAGTRHFVVGHAAAPLLAAFVLAWPVGWILRRRALGA